MYLIYLNCLLSLETSLKIESESGLLSKRLFRLLFGFSISGICLYFLLGAIEGDKLLRIFSEVKISYLISALLVTSLSYLVRAYRWLFLFTDIQLSFSNSYRCLTLGFFMNNVLPARIGEFVRAHSLGKIIGESRAKVLASVALERLLDGVTLSAIFGILFPLWSQNLENASLLFKVSYMFGFACCLTFLIFFLRKPIFSFLDILDRRIGISGVTYLLKRIEKFILGLEPLALPRLLAPIIILSLAVWAIEVCAYYLISLAFAQELNLGDLALFLAAVNFSSLVPAAPGGVGTIETFASFALAKVGIDHEVALAMVLSQHLIQFVAVGIPGIFYTINKYDRSPQLDIAESSSIV